MNGTVIADIKVYKSDNTIAIVAFVGDRVEGNGTNTVTKVIRNGNVKYLGNGQVNTWTGYITPDGIVDPPPPPDEEPPVETTDTFTAVVVDDKTGEMWSGTLTKK